MVAMADTKMIKMVLSLFSQLTGKLPSSTSRTVPPPMAVTNEMISVPKGSNLRSMAEKAPETAKAKVPRISMMFRKAGYMDAKDRQSPHTRQAWAAIDRHRLFVSEASALCVLQQMQIM